MFITITIDTDHPEAWENIRADLEMLVEDRDEDGTAYANAVRMRSPPEIRTLEHTHHDRTGVAMMGRPEQPR